MILPDLSAFETDPAASAVLGSIRNERWRKARDAAKELCRKDKARYLPLLIAANAGLAQDLWNRGLGQDAAAVLEYLKTIAPPELLTALKARQEENQAEVNLKKATGGRPEDLAAWRLAQAAATVLDAGGETTAESVHAVDRLVTASWNPPEDTSAFSVELRAVRAAVQATGDGLWEEARLALQALPRRSVFQHWRFFLRGVRHVHLGEKEEAQRCFDALPPHSTPARAAAPYRELLHLPPVAARAPEEASLSLLAAMAGLPPAWATPLVEAQRHWKRQKLDKAYEALANPLRQHFPTNDPGWGAVLTDIVFASRSGKSALPHAAQQDLVDYLLDRYLNEKFRSDRERLFALRFFLHEDQNALDAATAEEYGDELVKTWARVSGPDALRASAIWTMICGYLQPAAANGSLPPPKPSEKLILSRIHEKASSLDPENPAPAVRLAQYLLSVNKQSAYNAQLTALGKRFPEHKGVLRLSAEESIRRKSWPKALKTLHQAYAADPSDRAIVELMLQVLQAQVMGLHSKGQPVADTLWKEMEPLLLDLPTDPAQVSDVSAIGQSRWALYTFQGFSGLAGQSDAAACLAPSPWTHLFMLHLVMQRSGFLQVQLTPDTPPSWQDLWWFVRLLQWDEASRERSWKDQNELSGIFRTFLKAIKKRELNRGQGNLVAAVYALQKAFESSHPAQSGFWAGVVGEFSAAMHAAAKKNAPYQIKFAAAIFPADEDEMARAVPVLQDILAEATAAHDGPAIGIINHYLGIALSRNSLPPPDWEVEDLPDPPWESGNNWETDAEGKMDGALLFAIQAMAAALKLFPKSTIQETQERFIAGGMPPQAFDEILVMAKLVARTMTKKQAREFLESNDNTSNSGALPPPPAAPLPPPRTSRKTKTNPFQPDLFSGL